MSQFIASIFWISAAERAVKTAAQSALLTIGADQLNANEAGWKLVAGMAAGGALLSVLTSFASVKVTGDIIGDPSLV